MPRKPQPVRCASPEQSVEIALLEGLRARLPHHLALLRSLADLYTEVGRFEDGHRIDQFLVAMEPEDEGAWYNLACSQALVGLPEQALASLSRAIQAGYDDAAWMRKDPDLASLHGLPGFATVLAHFPAAGPGPDPQD